MRVTRFPAGVNPEDSSQILSDFITPQSSSSLSEGDLGAFWLSSSKPSCGFHWVVSPCLSIKSWMMECFRRWRFFWQHLEFQQNELWIFALYPKALLHYFVSLAPGLEGASVVPKHLWTVEALVFLSTSVSLGCRDIFKRFFLPCGLVWFFLHFFLMSKCEIMLDISQIKSPLVNQY